MASRKISDIDAQSLTNEGHATGFKRGMSEATKGYKPPENLANELNNLLEPTRTR
jgi:hypothetical protein